MTAAGRCLSMWGFDLNWYWCEQTHMCLCGFLGGEGAAVPAMCLKWQKVLLCEIKQITGDGTYYLSAFQFSAPVPLFMILFLDMPGLRMFFLWLLLSPFNLKSSPVDFCRVRPTKTSQQCASSTGTRTQHLFSLKCGKLAWLEAPHQSLSHRIQPSWLPLGDVICGICPQLPD